MGSPSATTTSPMCRAHTILRTSGATSSRSAESALDPIIGTQPQPEPRPTRSRVDQVELAALQLGQGPADGEAETRSALAPGPRRVDAVEALEEPGAVRLRDACALVDDGDVPPVGFEPGRDRNNTAARRVADRVVDEV